MLLLFMSLTFTKGLVVQVEILALEGCYDEKGSIFYHVSELETGFSFQGFVHAGQSWD